jgi:pimeloyl-ACP methyl ester carboxylesterase
MPLTFLDHGKDGTPPLIILHGLFGSGRNWGTIAKRLANSYHVFALDLPNHGRSDWTEDMDYPHMADAVVGWMDGRGLDSAVVLGHSMGGKVAMQMALRHGGRVDRLIVVDIAPVSYPRREHLSLITAMQAADVAAASRRSEVERQLEAGIETPMLRKFLAQNLVNDTASGGFRWQINLDVLARRLDDLMDFPLAPEMEPYGGPTFFLAGGASDYLRPEHEAAIARLFPDHAIHRIDAVGHWLHAEVPGVFTEHVLDFLARAG